MNTIEFNIEMPFRDWSDQTVYAFEGPKIDDTDHLLLMSIDRVLRQNSIERFAQEKIRAITESLQSAEILRNQEITIPGGNPAFDFVIKWVIDDKSIKFRRHIFVIYQNRGFSVYCDFSKKSYRMLSHQFKSMIEHFFPGTYSAPQVLS